MKQYSVDLCERLPGAIDAGLSQAEASRLFGVGTSTVTRWRQHQRDTGAVAPKPRSGRRPVIGADQAAALRVHVAHQSDATLADHCATWARDQGIGVSVATMSRAIRRLGITRKKVLHAAERDPVRRAAWWDPLEEVDPTALVFVDETGPNLAMTPRQGRAPRGERVVGTVPRNHGRHPTLVAALSLDGLTAAMTLEGAMDRLADDVFVDQVLGHRLKPGQVVVWDNLSVHKSADAQRRIEAAGGQLRWLPPYSPDFPPIEQAFSKRKTHLRGVAARSFEPLLTAIGTGLDGITTSDIRGYDDHCGFSLPEPDEQPS